MRNVPQRRVSNGEKASHEAQQDGKVERCVNMRHAQQRQLHLAIAHTPRRASVLQVNNITRRTVSPNVVLLHVKTAFCSWLLTWPG